ncbi:ATP-binding protein [Actinomadura sp. NPDC048955]|uniref:sensor histidine kinase n=1 Tax=Actinomadura sp. NPDC048955 TaxID=3158228 RepID=UPI0033DB3E91
MTSSNPTPPGPAHAAPSAPGRWPWWVGALLLACMVIYPVVVYALIDRSDAQGLQLTTVAVSLAGAALVVMGIVMRRHESDRYHRHRRAVADQLLRHQVAGHATAIEQMSSWRQHIDSGFARLISHLEGSGAHPGTGELAGCLGRTDEHLGAIARHLEQLTHLQPAHLPPALASGGVDAGERGAGDEPDREVLVYVGHRVHSLVSRQLAGFKAAEREEEDPDRLDALYELDHLAVQLRRAAARLAVLGGRTARRAHEPVPVSTLLRQAVTEIEDYDRVQLTLPDDDPRVAGLAGPDVIHVLAELLENATKFSRPGTAVLMSTRSMAGGLAVEIRDEGLGLKGEKLEELRRILAAPELISPREQVRRGQIGILVAARLAARHNLRIGLHPDGSGTRAVVVVPHTLLSASAATLGAPMTSVPELPRRRATTPAGPPAAVSAVAPASQSVAVPASAVLDGSAFDTCGLDGSDTAAAAAPGPATPPPVDLPSAAPTSASTAAPGPATPPPEGSAGRPPLPRRSQSEGPQVPAAEPASPAPQQGQPPTTGLLSKFTSGLRDARSVRDDQRHDRPGQTPRSDLTDPGTPSAGLPGPELTGRDRPDDPAAN